MDSAYRDASAFLYDFGRTNHADADGQPSVEEVFLTAAQSLFAIAVLANLSFSLTEAGVLFVLFSTQLLIPDPRFRYFYSLIYMVITLGMFTIGRENRRSFFALFHRRVSSYSVHKG